MKKRITHGIVLLLSLALAGCACAEAASESKPWPTHAPEATPYVRVYNEADVPRPEEGEHFESMEDLWRSIYAEFGHFYAKQDELEMFRALPQDEPFSFVPHSARFTLDEGEAMRMARLFDALDGCEAEVIALHQVVDSLDDWGFLTVVTMTPVRMFELSEELDEIFMIEQFYDQVRERFDIAYWPDGLYEQTAEALKDYEKRGCFYFEDETLECLEKLDRNEVCKFSMREYTPSGWNEDANSMLSILRTHDGMTFSLYYKSEEPESLCVAAMTPSRLSMLSDVLPGRYLVRIADEEELSGYDGMLRFSPEGEALERE